MRAGTHEFPQCFVAGEGNVLHLQGQYTFDPLPAEQEPAFWARFGGRDWRPRERPEGSKTREGSI